MKCLNAWHVSKNVTAFLEIATVSLGMVYEFCSFFFERSVEERKRGICRTSLYMDFVCFNESRYINKSQYIKWIRAQNEIMIEFISDKWLRRKSADFYCVIFIYGTISVHWIQTTAHFKRFMYVFNKIERVKRNLIASFVSSIKILHVTHYTFINYIIN